MRSGGSASPPASRRAIALPPSTSPSIPPPGSRARARPPPPPSAINPATIPAALRRPGHIFPLRARPGGVLQRVGQTEASVDLARLAGLGPAGGVWQALNSDGPTA